jgi:hypothetical protein
MAESSLPLHIRMFNERVRALNQSRSRTLTLTQSEAQSLHAEIYELLTQIAELSKSAPKPDALNISMDGGGFR